VLRLLVRSVSLLLLAGAFAAAVVDGARSLANQELTLTSTGVALATAFPGKIDQFTTLAQNRLPHFLWDPVLLSILYAPTFLDLGVLGIALSYLSRPRRKADLRSIMNS
jgi:hypothetical protein